MCEINHLTYHTNNPGLPKVYPTLDARDIALGDEDEGSIPLESGKCIWEQKTNKDYSET